MRVILPVVAIFAAILMALSLAFPEALRNAGDSGALTSLIQLLMVAILVGSGLFGRGEGEKIGFGQGVKYAAIWVGISLFLIAAYSQREGFQRLWAGITGEIDPSSAHSSDGTVTLRKADDGHFWAVVRINGQRIRMLVDTGSSDVALAPEDASRVGIDLSTLVFNVPVSTANGRSYGAAIKLETVGLGDIVRNKVPASVMQATGGVSLLGMAFLGELSDIRAEGDTLTLRD
jgi:aspartyl protease family protein